MNALESKMAEIASTVARRYRYRCWWTEQRDLEQQAWVGVLSAYHVVANAVYDRRRELPEDRRAAFPSIAYHAAWAQVGRYVWRQASPVSAADHKVRNLLKLERTGITEDVALDDRDPEQLYAAAEYAWVTAFHIRPAIAKRIAELYARTGRPPAYLDATIDIFLDGKSPATAARESCVDVQGVYKTTAEMRGMFRKDRMMREFARQLVEGRS